MDAKQLSQELGMTEEMANKILTEHVLSTDPVSTLVKDMGITHAAAAAILEKK